MIRFCWILTGSMGKVVSLDFIPFLWGRPRRSWFGFYYSSDADGKLLFNRFRFLSAVFNAVSNGDILIWPSVSKTSIVTPTARSDRIIIRSVIEVAVLLLTGRSEFEISDFRNHWNGLSVSPAEHQPTLDKSTRCLCLCCRLFFNQNVIIMNNIWFFGR